MREFFINKSRANTDKVGNNAQPIKGQAIKPNEGTDIKPFVKTGRSFTLGNRKKSVQNVETKICGDAGVSACQNSEAPDLGGVNIRKKVSNDLKGLRTANSKHFIENGKRQAVFFGGAVHKKNKSGKYEDIDCCLTDNGKAFEHTEGNLSVAFSKDHENGLLYSLKSGERKAEIYLAGSRGLEENERDIKTDLKANAKVRGIKGKKGEIIAETAKKLQSVCRIENAFQGVDLEYVYKPDRVKENIIVKEKNGSYNF
jgi:hypothetical protein